jgi:hypothetical protein
VPKLIWPQPQAGTLADETPLTRHTRLLEFLHAQSLINARLADLREETRGTRCELICD